MVSVNGIATALAKVGIIPASTINAETLALFKWIEEQLQARRSGYELFRNYFEGQHRVLLSDRLKAFLPQGLQESFRDNYCEVVINAVLNRLDVTGFTSNSEQLAGWAWELWQAQRMDATQGVVHVEALITGDGYLLVDWDADAMMPRFTPQLAEMIVPHYSETTRQMDFASKKWLETGAIGDKPRTRLNLYYPERVEKYIAGNNVWIEHREEGETVWPQPWVDGRGEPIGVPLVHFRNNAHTSNFGFSELANVIPLQDLLNKTLVDLLQILDTMAFAQRWTLNVSHESSTVDTVPGSWSTFHAEEDGAQVGEWAAADVGGPLRALEAFVQQIASTSRTPQHLFQIGSGGPPSGEALKTSESGLVHKVRHKMVSLGNSWEDAMMLAARVQGAFGEQVPGADIARLETTWGDPETRNEEAFLTGLGVKHNQLGVPRQQIWREMGYDADEIAQMEADLQAEKAADANLGGEILKQFSQGQLPGGGGAIEETAITRPRRTVRHQFVERDLHTRQIVHVRTEEESE